MADILNTSLTGLLAFQSALATTSHNVANVNTEGYSRQRVQFATAPPSNEGFGFVGRGVQVDSVSRVLDMFRLERLRTNISEQGRLDTLNELTAGIDTLLASSDIGLSQPLSSFLSGLQNLADNPASITARQSVLADAGVLADRFATLSGRLDSRAAEVEARLGAAVTNVNALAETVAELNLAIRDASAAGGAPPNDLLDQRDLVLRELSGQIGLSLVEQSDGMVNVFIASGQALVLGADASTLAVASGNYASAQSEIVMVVASGSQVRLGSLGGGSLGGLLDFRREVLDPARNDLGRMATALAEAANDQHRQGMDLDGNLGGDLFSIAPPAVMPGFGNTGAGQLGVTVSDSGGLTAGDYVLAYDGASYSLTRADSGASVALTGSGTPADPYLADGLAIVVNAAPAAGDSFLIRPTVAAAASLNLVVTDPRQLAAALPVVSAADIGNVGSGSIGGDEMLDVTDPSLLDPVTIRFIDATTYSINGAGSFAYTSGAPIELNGWRTVISGAPGAGDTFTVTSSAGGVGDNRNALALSDVLEGGVLEGGSTSIRAGYENLVSDVATTVRSIGVNLTAQNAITERALTDHQSVSGVNLDEEAANMLRYQQSYQAAAQIITVADLLFQTILSMTAR